MKSIPSPNPVKKSWRLTLCLFVNNGTTVVAKNNNPKFPKISETLSSCKLLS